MNKKKTHERLLVGIILSIVVALVLCIILFTKSISSTEKTEPTEETGPALTAFSEDPEQSKYKEADAAIIFSQELRDKIVESQLEFIQEYFETQTEETSETDENITEADVEIEADETSIADFDFVKNLSETKKKKLVEEYTDALLSTVILSDYSEDILYENAKAETEEDKALLSFMLSNLFQDEEVSEMMQEEYGTWYEEYSNRTTFESIISELQFISVADKNYLCMRGTLLECPDDVTDISACNMEMVMIGKQGNTYFYIVTDKTYSHQYLISFASQNEYSLSLYQ